MLQIGSYQHKSHQPQKPSKVAFSGGKPSKQTMSYLSELCSEIEPEDRRLAFVDLSKIKDIFKGIPVFDGIKVQDFFTKGFSFDSILLQMGCVHQCVHCGADAPKRIKTMLFDNHKKVVDGLSDLAGRLGFYPFSSTEKNRTISLYANSDPINYNSRGQDGIYHNIYDAAKYLHDKTGIKTDIQTAGWLTPFQQKAAEQFAGDSSMLETFGISVHPFHSFMERFIQADKKGDASESTKWRNAYTDMIANAIQATSAIRAKLGENSGIIMEYVDTDVTLVEPDRMKYYQEDAVQGLYDEILDKVKSSGSSIDNLLVESRPISMLGRGSGVGSGGFETVLAKRSIERGPEYNSVMISPNGEVLSNPYADDSMLFSPRPVLNSDGTPMKLNFCGHKSFAHKK